MTYLMLTEGMTLEQRGEIDELLAGPTVVARKRRASTVAAVGGEVTGSKRKANAR